MNQQEYEQELKHLNKRFDGEIEEAQRRYDKALKAYEKERQDYNAWCQANAATFAPSFFAAEQQNAAAAAAEQRRRPLDATQAELATAADSLTAVKANKASRVSKARDLYGAYLHQQSRANVEKQLASLASL